MCNAPGSGYSRLITKTAKRESLFTICCERKFSFAAVTTRPLARICHNPAESAHRTLRCYAQQDDDRYSAIARGRLSRMLVLGLFASAGAAVIMQVSGNTALASQETVTLLTIFVAALVSSIAGFAFSALAAAVLMHVYASPTDMVRVLLVSSIAVQLHCGYKILPTVNWRAVGHYLAGGVLTMPAGLLILHRALPKDYALWLGAFLVAYAAYALARPFTIRVNENTAMRMSVGALGGLTGGLAAFPGAFVVMWCSARGLDKHAQRAICQPYILIMQIATLAGLELLNRSPTDALVELSSVVPVAVLGAYLGFSVFERVSTAQFKSIVLTLLGLSGALLVAEGW